MIHFNLNIDRFYETELKNDSEVKAIACIEYPVVHIIAKTLETMEENYDGLDRFIVQTAYRHLGFSITQFSELTGLNPGVFKFRAEELVKQQYISLVDEVISPIEKGMEFLNDPTFEREIEKTRSLLLDGFTHQPLTNYFYKDGKDYLISEEERDSWGNKIFNPSIIHNPPGKDVVQQITAVPLEERLQYNIPVGLKEIRDYHFVLMTYPLPVVFSKNKEGGVYKRIIDGFTLNSNSESIALWQKKLEEEIEKTEILIDERSIEKNSIKSRKIQFKSNWGNTRTGIKDRIFNTSAGSLSYFIQKLYNVQSLDESNISLSPHEIKILVNRKLFETQGVDKKKLLESCLRKRDYFRQNAGTGVWLVFFEIAIADDFIQRLVDLHNLLHQEITIEELLLSYQSNYKPLRQDLISMDRFDILENLDIHLFLYARETNFTQNYLKLQNE